MKNLWIRLGATCNFTDEEIDMIFNGDESDFCNAVIAAIAEHRFCLDGECYVPACCIDDFNDSYGTDYCSDSDIGFDIYV